MNHRATCKRENHKSSRRKHGKTSLRGEGGQTFLMTQKALTRNERSFPLWHSSCQRMFVLQINSSQTRRGNVARKSDLRVVSQVLPEYGGYRLMPSRTLSVVQKSECLFNCIPSDDVSSPFISLIIAPCPWSAIDSAPGEISASPLLAPHLQTSPVGLD